MLGRLEDLWLNDNSIPSLDGLDAAVSGSREKLTTIYLENNPCVSLSIPVCVFIYLHAPAFLSIYLWTYLSCHRSLSLHPYVSFSILSTSICRPLSLSLYSASLSIQCPCQLLSLLCFSIYPYVSFCLSFDLFASPFLTPSLSLSCLLKVVLPQSQMTISLSATSSWVTREVDDRSLPLSRSTCGCHLGPLSKVDFFFLSPTCGCNLGPLSKVDFFSITYL